MSKISCDVNKDLLASYLDGICSEESRGLVEGHLKECAACRQFVEQIQEQDLGKEAVKVDFFKKVKWSVDIRSWMVVALALLLVFMGHPKIHYQSLDMLLYYMAMPILMLTGALALKGNEEKARAAKKERVIPVLGTVLICVILIVQALICSLTSGIAAGKISLPFPQTDLGPCLDLVNTCIVMLSAMLLIVSFFRLKGRKGLCVVSMNLAWLGMNLALACDTILYHMEDGAAIVRTFRNVILILILEFAVMTALTLVFFRRSDIRKRAS